MKHVEVLSRQRCFALYNKDSVEPKKTLNTIFKG